MMALYLAFLGLLAIRKLRDLLRSRRHVARLVAAGGLVPTPDRTYRYLIVTHLAFFVLTPLEVVILHRPFIPWLGGTMLMLFAGAALLRGWATALLAAQWNSRVTVQAAMVPVTTGPYRFIRHPNYLGMSLELLAAGLMYSAWIATLTVGVLNAVAVVLRIREEESALLRIPAWRAAMARKSRLLPGLYGLVVGAAALWPGSASACPSAPEAALPAWTALVAQWLPLALWLGFVGGLLGYRARRFRHRYGFSPIVRPAAGDVSAHAFLSRMLVAYFVVLLVLSVAVAVRPEALGGGRSPALLVGAGLLAVVAAGLIWRGQEDLAASWRVGIDPAKPTEFITRGLYRHCRHPIYVGLQALLAAYVLLIPGLWSLLLVAVALPLFQVQARLEEAFLLLRHGDAYAQYCARVGRFLPWTGRWPMAH